MFKNEEISWNEFDEFWNELKKIQKITVDTYSYEYSKYADIEDFLNEVTFNTIYSFIELLDGLKNENIKGEIINLKSNNIINRDNLLHDFCEDYLKSSNI